MRHALEKLPVRGTAWKQQGGHGCWAYLDPDSFRFPCISRVVLEESQVPILWSLRVFHALGMEEVERELIKDDSQSGSEEQRCSLPRLSTSRSKSQLNVSETTQTRGNLGPDAPLSILAFCKLHSEFRFASSRISEYAGITSCTQQHTCSSRK